MTMKPLLLASAVSAALALCVPACGHSSSPSSVDGNVAYFDLDGALDTAATFYDLPFPSDLRLLPSGGPDLTGFPNPRGVNSVEQLRAAAEARQAFPMVPVAWFRFHGELPPQSPDHTYAAKADSPLLLIDVDPASPERGRLLPMVAALPSSGDEYTPDFLLAVAPRPGFVLAPTRRYAFVVMRALGDANGKPLGVPTALEELAAGKAPSGRNGAAAQALYQSLWDTLSMLKLDATQVAAATVFTTGDVVAETAQTSEGLRQKYQAEIRDLHQNADGDTYDGYCYLEGTLHLPQFQTGTPPFNAAGSGVFELDGDGLPKEQGAIDVPMLVTLPKQPMPAAGYPLLLYFHGSGGFHDEVVQRGAMSVMDGPEAHGLGPAYYHAKYGLATAGTAMPVNPERLPDATDFAYINFQNLGAMPFVFREGVIEQRLFLDALVALRIDPEALDGCAGPELPEGATQFRFDAAKLVAEGQSMGGMYTNMVGAVEPRLRALVPTGAGGFWSSMMLHSGAVPNTIVGVLLGSDTPENFLHPGAQLLEMAWEAAEPYVYVPRLARSPLPGHPVRPIYEPVAPEDHYFPTDIYDAMATAYGNQEAGEVVWPSMQESLALDGRGELASYPVSNNVRSADGTPYTGVVVQYRGDGIGTAHSIFAQLDAVKYQYGCFLSTFLATGKAVVPAPAPLGTPCPTE